MYGYRKKKITNNHEYINYKIIKLKYKVPIYYA